MATPGPKTNLNEEQVRKLRIAVTVLGMHDAKSKRSLRNKRIAGLRVGRNKLVKNLSKDKCAICDEKRALEICHIVPVHISSEIDGYKHLGQEVRNTIILCKNHHWCFDHKLLNPEELELIYIIAKDFINSELFELCNSNISIAPGVRVSTFERNSLARFNEWKSWAADCFFNKNVWET